MGDVSLTTTIISNSNLFECAGFCLHLLPGWTVQRNSPDLQFVLELNS